MGEALVAEAEDINCPSMSPNAPQNIKLNAIDA